MNVNWFDKAADWAWMLIVAAITGLLALIRRVMKHESRIKALEVGADDRTQQLRDINLKLDGQTSTLMERIDKQGAETRADIRMITAKLMDKVPGA
jgi:hypothetical protein